MTFCTAALHVVQAVTMAMPVQACPWYYDSSEHTDANPEPGWMTEARPSYKQESHFFEDVRSKSD